MLLAIDIGNTYIKAAVFEGTGLIEKSSFDKTDAVPEVGKIFQKYPRITHSALSTVGEEHSEMFLFLEKNSILVRIGRESMFPFVNKYETPRTLGIDRMVLAAGAVLQFPGQNRLVIDAGTCVTYDFINDRDEYLGGAISPGLRIRYEAMHTFTAKLPLLYPEMPQGMTGASTAASMHSGAVNGLVYEVGGFVQGYVEQYQQVTIILTGGDAEFLAKRLKNTIFANSNFLLESLNQLYLYTTTND